MIPYGWDSCCVVTQHDQARCSRLAPASSRPSWLRCVGLMSGPYSGWAPSPARLLSLVPRANGICYNLRSAAGVLWLCGPGCWAVPGLCCLPGIVGAARGSVCSARFARSGAVWAQCLPLAVPRASSAVTCKLIHLQRTPSNEGPGRAPALPALPGVLKICINMLNITVRWIWQSSVFSCHRNFLK